MTRDRRVAHVVCTANFAGVERYVTYVVPSLVQRGWDVTVVGGNTERMQESLGEVRHVPASSVLSAMSTLVRLDRSAIVHAHMTAAETASAASHVVRRFPLVVTRHFAARRGSSTLGRLVAPFIRRTMNEQIAISDFVARAIGEPAVTIRNAVPDSEEAFDRERTVLLVQRLETEKHTADALHAWAATTLPSEGWRLQIAGGGSRRDALVSLSRELGVDASVDFLGVRGDVGLLMQRASILVATAPAEPFGLSVVEAMACGLPVIAALGGAHLETVGAVSAHWMYESGHHAELAQKLRALARSESARADYGRALQEHQRSQLSIEAHVDQLENVYKRVAR